MGHISHQCISDLNLGRKKNPQCSEEEFSARFEEKDGHLAQVEVDEVLRLVGDVAAEVPPDNAVPGGIVLLIKLLEDTQSGEFIQDQRFNVTIPTLANFILHLF